MKKINIQLGGIKKIEILLFTKHLSVTLKSGLTIIEGIEIVLEQAQGKMKKMVTKILKSVKEGETFYNALSDYPKYFSPFYINMIKTGEFSGNLEENLSRVVLHLQKKERLKKSIRSAMIYPAVIMVAMIGIGVALATFVLPKILPLFKSLNVELPATTKALIFIAEAFEKDGFFISAGIFASMVFIGWLLRLKVLKPIIHRIILSLPVIKTIARNVNIQRFTSTLAVLLKSGISIDEGLNIISEAMENKVYAKTTKEIIPKIEGGISIEAAMSYYPELFPPLIYRMIGVGEKTGTLEDTLQYLGEYYEEIVDDTVKDLSTIIEPVVLIIVGALVGVVALSIIGPMAQLTSSI